MENFTPVSALIGGALIGLAAAMLMLFLGRIAGISGIIDGALFQKGSDQFWRMCFLIGIVLGALLYALASSDVAGQPVLREGYPRWLIIAGGLLVGYGTRLGNGCTSGHGVCGMALFSIRSVIATLVFMASAIATVYVLRHILGVIA